MTWLTLNRLFTFIGPKIRAVGVLLAPTSLAVSGTLSHVLHKTQSAGTSTLSIGLFVLAGITYYCARLLHHVSCPDQFRGIVDYEGFNSKEVKLLASIKTLQSKRRDAEESLIKTELIGVVDNQVAARVAKAIAAKVHLPITMRPQLNSEEGYTSQSPVARISCFTLLLLCGIAYLASTAFAIVPILRVVGR